RLAGTGRIPLRQKTHTIARSGARYKAKTRRQRQVQATPIDSASADTDYRLRKLILFPRKENQPSKRRALPRYRNDRAEIGTQQSRQPRNRPPQTSGRRHQRFAPTSVKAQVIVRRQRPL